MLPSVVVPALTTASVALAPVTLMPPLSVNMLPASVSETFPRLISSMTKTAAALFVQVDDADTPIEPGESNVSDVAPLRIPLPAKLIGLTIVRSAVLWSDPPDNVKVPVPNAVLLAMINVPVASVVPPVKALLPETTHVPTSSLLSAMTAPAVPSVSDEVSSFWPMFVPPSTNALAPVTGALMRPVILSVAVEAALSFRMPKPAEPPLIMRSRFVDCEVDAALLTKRLPPLPPMPMAIEVPAPMALGAFLSAIEDT